MGEPVKFVLGELAAERGLARLLLLIPSLLISRLTLLLGDVFTGVRTLLSEVRWKVRACPFLALVGGIVFIGVVSPLLVSGVKSLVTHLESVLVSIAGKRLEARGVESSWAAATEFAAFWAEFLCLLKACLLFWNQIWIAFSDMLQRSASCCLFRLSGAGHWLNSA